MTFHPIWEETLLSDVDSLREKWYTAWDINKSLSTLFIITYISAVISFNMRNRFYIWDAEICLPQNVQWNFERT